MTNLRTWCVAAVIVLCGVALGLTQGGLVANAGPDQNNALVGTAVSLNGSGSVGATSYAWTFTSRPSGSAATLTGAATATPTFTPDRGGTYVVRLTVGNGTTTATDSVNITTVNRAPVADAGPDAALAVGKSFSLVGTGSADPDNDTLTYLWTIVSAPPSSAGIVLSPAKAKAKLILDRAGTYVVQLVVKDGVLTSAPDQAVITTVNTIPVANAGPDRAVPLSSIVELDGTASSDLDGDELTYSWKLKKPGGSQAVLSTLSGARPTFVPDVHGNYTATLTVSDGQRTKTDNVTVTTNANLAPVARAGVDHPALAAGQKIVLDGSASTDADGDLLTYAWAITKKPGASTAPLGSPNAVRSTFTADVNGKYTFTLTVTDPSGAVSTDQVVYSAALPVADAGPDQSVLPGAPVELDGSASSHLTGVLWYGWSLVSVPAGSAAALDDVTDPQPQFVADVPGLYVAQLVVFDGTLLSAADTVVVSAGDNMVPRIDLGPDRVVPASTIVTLDSGAVTDPDPGALALRWALLARPAGSSAALTSSTGDVTQLALDVAGAYVVQLIAIDQAGALATGTAVLTTAKGRPSASAGPDRGATVGASLPLSVAVSEPDGTGVALSWRLLLQPDGSSAAIVNPTSATPSFTPDVEGAYVVQVIARDPDGLEAIDALVVRAITGSAIVTIEATDSAAAENGADPGTFTFTRSGSTTAALTGVAYTRSGTATPGTDYSPSLPASGTVDFAAGSATATITITPVNDGVGGEGPETVVLTLVDGVAYDLGDPSSQSATVTITDASGGGGGSLTNGGMDTGAILLPGEVDTWTFPASIGDRIGVHLGEVTGGAEFVPWIVLKSPSGTVLRNTWSAAAVAIEAVAAEAGTYSVLIASNDSGQDGTGTYRLSLARTAGPYTTAPGDQGGGLTNGAIHTGDIVRGDVDVWTFTATAGARIAVHLAEVTGDADFTPWIRLWSPTGASLRDTWSAAAIPIELEAPVTGIYTVLVASNDSGQDAAGTYRLEMAMSPGPYTVSPGDQGGGLTNGAIHTGDIVRGDVDVWTFTATAGARIAVHLAEVTGAADFTPWIRLWSPAGGAGLRDTWSAAAIPIELEAPVTGVYTVLVASNDSGQDATGTYRLEMAMSPGPYTVSPGDQGGGLTNGAIHTGDIVRGDVDVWTFTATAGARIGVHLAEVTGDADFTPWIRLWSPAGGAGLRDTWSAAAIPIEIQAPVTGVYTVLVASNDSGQDATGTYRLEMAMTPGPYTVSPGDQGGGLTNGAIHTGDIVRGDVDVWTFTATAGDRIGVHLAEVTGDADFTPWVRLWSPAGASVRDTWSAAAIPIEAVAPVTGVYTVLVATNDSGQDATGTYRLEFVRTPGPYTLSAGDDGGALTNGAVHNGTIVRGDVDAWTISAVAGQHIAVIVNQTSELSDFTPWIRVWSPAGGTIGDTWGAAGATLNPVAPVTGTYLVLVASNDSGQDGEGTYSLEVTVGP